MKYRKKPVEVEAYQFTQELAASGEHKGVNDKAVFSEVFCNLPISSGRYYVATLEGHMTVGEDDWIIEGVNGEYYPCKPDIFEKTYDAVTPLEELIESELAKIAKWEEENSERRQHMEKIRNEMNERFEERRKRSRIFK